MVFTSKNGHFTQQQWQFTVDLREQTWYYEASPRYIYHNSSEPDDQPTDVATFCRFEVWDSNYEANEPCALQFLGVLVDLKESSGRSMIYL